MWKTGCVIVYMVLCIALRSAAQETVSGTIGEILASAMRNAGTPGGIEVVADCREVREVRIAVPAHAGVEETLLLIRNSGVPLQWQKLASGAYLIRIGDPSIPSVGSLKLGAMQVEAQSLSLIADTLLQQPIIADELRKRNVRVLAGEIGFGSINERQRRKIDLPAQTLSEDFATVAAAFRRAIWLSTETECRGTHTFRLDWVAK